MNILIIDNYDSFTFNLYQYIGEILMSLPEGIHSHTIMVKRNDEITKDAILSSGYNRIIISPGPGNPGDPAYFGVCADVITHIGKTIPTLGVCLGMQGIAHYYGGTVTKSSLPMHGKTSLVEHDGKGVFAHIPQYIPVMRYHSLVVDPTNVPDCLEITATVHEPNPLDTIETSLVSSQHQAKKETNTNGQSTMHMKHTRTTEIMGLRHKKYPIKGIQFHPESFATEGGKQMLKNFLQCHAKLRKADHPF